MTTRYLPPPKNRRNRDMEALRLRTRGWTVDQIAEHLSFSGANPSRQAASAIRRAAAKLVRFPANEVKLLELEGLDELESIEWRKLSEQYPLTNARGIVYDESGTAVADQRLHQEIIDRIMKIKDRRAKLLGLDAPARSEVITLDLVDQEIAQLEQQLRKNDGAHAANDKRS
jgi:hypothetical protein